MRLVIPLSAKLLLIASIMAASQLASAETCYDLFGGNGQYCVSDGPPPPPPKCGVNPVQCTNNFQLAVNSYNYQRTYWGGNLLTLRNKALAARTQVATANNGFYPARFTADVAAKITAAISGSNCLIDRGLAGLDDASAELYQVQKPVDICTIDSQATCDQYTSTFNYQAYINQTNTAQYIEGVVTKPYGPYIISYSVLPPVKALILNPKNLTAQAQLTKALSLWRGSSATKACFPAQ